MSVIHS